MSASRLYLMPVWLGDEGGIERVPPMNIDIAQRVKTWFCEEERTARRMLRRMSRDLDLNAIELHHLDKDTTDEQINSFAELLIGRECAIISEAGMPCIADPGARLVALAHARGVEVVPLTGPSSILLALAASGMDGQYFTFHGYLPREQAQRRVALQKLEAEARRGKGAQLFIETPYRNDALLQDALSCLDRSTRLCLAVDLEQPGGSVRTRSIAEWSRSTPALGKRPCVFIIG